MSGQVSIWSFNELELSEYMQSVKFIIMRDLFKRGLISEEIFDEYVVKKFLVLRKPSFFSRAWKKIFRYENDGDYIILCTADGLDFKQDEEDQPGEKKPALKVVPLPEKNSE